MGTIFQHLKESRRTSEERPSTMTIATIVSLSRNERSYNERTLEDALKELRHWE
jgi:hypothetical protein